jgi:hypothetical protein
MCVQLAESVVLLQAMSTTRGVEQSAKPGNSAMFLEEMGTDASLAAKYSSTCHARMTLSLVLASLAFCFRKLLSHKAVCTSFTKEWKKCLMETFNSMMSLPLKNGMFSRSSNESFPIRWVMHPNALPCLKGLKRIR